MLTHLHLVVYTWWCWHICKGDEVTVIVDQLREEKNVFWCTLNYRIVLYWNTIVIHCDLDQVCIWDV